MRRLALSLALALSAIGCGGDEDAPLPAMFTLSDFSLTDQDGDAFSTEALHERVWIADLFFTSCPEICPVMSSQMANLTRRIEHEDVRFVSISVDPAVDTPEVLREYAARYRADHDRWTFLTGDVREVNRVVHQSFRLPMGDRVDRDDGRYDILHTGRFILVDRAMTVRGLYETDAAGLERLERDVERLRGGGE